MWTAAVSVVFVVLAALAFSGFRWAYFVFIVLGVLYFPARVGFHLHPQPCEVALNLPLAAFSLTNYGHLIRFTIFFLMTCVQARRLSPRAQFLIGLAAVVAMGIYVEAAEGITGEGHCRVRDLVPDLAGALIGAALWLPLRRWSFQEPGTKR